MTNKADIEIAKHSLLFAQSELHIARYLASGVQPKTGPSIDYRRRHVKAREGEVLLAIDRLWEVMNGRHHY